MPRVHSLQLALALLLVGGCTEAAAQRKSPRTMSLFGATPAATRGNDVQGMRPETVGAVARFSLALGTTSNLRARSGATRRLQIALPNGNSVTCLLSPVSRRQNMVVLAGAPAGGRDDERCNLVVENGRVTGEVELEFGTLSHPAGRVGRHARGGRGQDREPAG